MSRGLRLIFLISFHTDISETCDSSFTFKLFFLTEPFRGGGGGGGGGDGDGDDDGGGGVSSDIIEFRASGGEDVTVM